jgi:hypothetical protein
MAQTDLVCSKCVGRQTVNNIVMKVNNKIMVTTVPLSRPLAYTRRLIFVSASVHNHSGYGPDGRLSVSIKGKNCSLCNHIQTSFGAYPVTYKMSVVGCYTSPWHDGVTQRIVQSLPFASKVKIYILKI